MQKRYSLSAATIIAILIGAVFFMIDADPQTYSEEICDFIDNDGDGDIDEGFATTCRADSDCGESGEFGEPFCSDGDVYIGWYQVDCVGEVGTCDSKCKSLQTQQRVRKCSQGCSSGQCM